MADLPAGAVVNDSIHLGPFELLEPLARGGMSQVWRGLHTAGDLEVAIKIVADDGDDDGEECRRRFRNEIRSVARLRHPNIVRIYDYGEIPRQVAYDSGGRFCPDQPYIVMEYADGGTMGECDGPDDWPSLREALLTLLEALAHAHARTIVHRDLKPSNVLAVRRGDRLRLALSDFGLSYITESPSSRPGLDKGTRGTPIYMSPEQFREDPLDYGPWTDLYGLGCLAWELATGRPPFFARSAMGVAWKHLENEPPALEPRFEVPEKFEQWLRRLLHKKPHARFTCAGRAARSLLELDPPDGSDKQPPDFGRPGRFDAAADAPGLGPAPESLESPTHTASTSRPLVAGTNLSLFSLRDPPFVGRRRERRRLWESLEEVAEHDSPHVLALRGESGVGKSRLARWLRERAAEIGCATCLRAVHSPTGGTCDGLAAMIERFLRLHETKPADRLDAIEKWFRDRGVDEPYAWRSIAAILDDVGLWPAGAEPHEVQIERFGQRAAALVRLLRTAADGAPVVLHLDDLMWGPDSLQFANYVLDRVDDLPLLVVGTLRPERRSLDRRSRTSLERLRSADGFSEVSVDSLEPRAHRRLIGELLDLDSTLQQRLAEQTRRSPLFAVQAINSYIERDLLSHSGGAVDVDGDFDGELPDDLDEIWLQRLDTALPTANQQVAAALELAAALGRRVVESEWRRACRLAGVEPPAEIWERLFRQNLVRRTERGWAFCHPTLRDLLEERARQKGTWASRNRVCATLLEREYRGSKASYTRRLAGHALRADAPEQALGPLLRALTHADCTGAVEDFERLLTLAERSVEALDLSEHDARHAEFLTHRARYLMGSEQEDTPASTLLSRALESARANGYVRVRAQARRALGRLAHRLSEYEEAIEHYRRSLELMDASSPDHLRMATYRALGEALFASGEGRAARSAFRAGLEHASEYEISRAKIVHQVGESYAFEGRLDDARDAISRSREAFRSVGSLYGAANSANLLGDIARRREDLAAASEHYDRAARIAELTRITDLGHVFLSRAQIALQRGDFPRASSRLDRAGEEPKVRSHELMRQIYDALRTWAYAGSQDWGGCTASLESLEGAGGDLLDRNPDMRQALRHCLELARQAGRSDVAETCRDLLEESEQPTETSPRTQHSA